MSLQSRNQKATLYVEARLRRSDTVFVRLDLIREEISTWLRTNFVSLEVHQPIDHREGLSHAGLIEYISVVDTSSSDTEKAFFELEHSQIDVQVYYLHDEGTDLSQEEIEDDEEEYPISSYARTTSLPCNKFDGTWDSLVFETCLHGRLLRTLTRMVQILKKPELKLTTLNWNRILLLYGPPGTGKSTLCRALAQKLTIRLGNQFTQGKLLEVNSSSLFSKWFGESGKLISKIFQKVNELAEDEEAVVCVLIDEIESLTGSRERLLSSNECGDALRATNQLLTALDQLQNRANVVVLCTSNLLSAIDPAFLNRVDIKQLIPNPSTRACYEIFRSSINEMIRAGLVTPTELAQANKASFPDTVMQLGDDPKDAEVPLDVATSEESCGWRLIESDTILSFVAMTMRQLDDPSRRVWELAQRCEGLSGRVMRRLPFLSLAMHITEEQCSVDEAIAALGMTIDEELVGNSFMT